MKLTVNLEGNFLCPFQAFVDIISQLSQPVPSLSKVVFAPLCELTTINDWINLESWGKPSALRAHMLNAMLQPLLNSRGINALELDIAITTGMLTLDNLYLLLFLSETVTALSLTFYVKEENQALLQQTLAVFYERSNVSIQFSTSPLTVTTLQAQRQQLLHSIGFHFAESQETVTEEQAQKLIAYAWLCLKAGAYELGTTALENALNTLAPQGAMYENIGMHLQLTRFLSHQYHAVTQAAFPETFHFLAANDATSLYFIKAYAATLTRNLAVAEEYFKKCQVSETMPLSDENSLYRLNLYALFQALQGHDEVAMTLEMRIKAFVKAEKMTIVGLKYVNFINIARLYKKAQQFDEALTYYALAYKEISGGGYTTADRIYYNMNKGAVYEALGNAESALHYWLNAALHWLTYENKYALSWRPRLILCQEKITDILQPLPVARAHTFLAEKIKQLMIRCGISLTANAGSPLQFTAESTQCGVCYLAKNIILYSAPDAAVASSKPLSKEEAELTAIVSQCLQHLIPLLPEKGVLMLDTHHEGWYPSTAEQCAFIAATMGCKKIYFNGRVIDYTPTTVHAQFTALQVRLTPAIRSITTTDTTVQLEYGRSFLNKKISVAGEIALITRLQHQGAIGCQQLTAAEQATMHSLIDQKVLVYHLPELALESLPLS